ncbi:MULTISPECIES: AMP-binding protein [unclassified Frankia]|uniref:AMP-binding protein n=1 Tax=unclassified Frankia TaxID=2632575 RepID=UPI001EF4B2EF|nr:MULTISPECIES: AMP-binding protein [unclassified Frankia]
MSPVPVNTWPTLAELLAEHARSRPGHAATVCGDTRMTYAELDGRVTRLAGALRAAGVTRGSRVLWLGQTCHRVLELLLAGSRLGAMVCPVNWRHSAEEMAFVIDDLRPAVVVWQDAEIGPTTREARKRATHTALWLRHDSDGAGSGGAGSDSPDTYEGFLAAGDAQTPLAEPDPHAPVLVIYTAAHGGRPAGSMLTSANLIAQGTVIGALFHADGDQIFLNSGPLFHIGTFQHTAATFIWGGTNVFVRRSDPEELCRLIADERCTSAFLMPPQVTQLVETNRDGRFDLRSLRSPLTMIPGWKDMVTSDDSPWGRYMGGFGQTEVTGFCLYAALGHEEWSPTVGRPVPFARITIVGPDDVEVPDGAVGEIVVRGALVHAGYWDRPRDNAHRTRTGGWHTTDLGRRLPDGRISFVGTATRMIKSAAENIYPAEVEACLERHPAVQEAAVIGVPDDRWVQSVKAIVVLRDGTDATGTELIEHCRSQIASFKKPRTVVFVDALPRSNGAKDYDMIDAAHGGGNYPGGTTSHGH